MSMAGIYRPLLIDSVTSDEAQKQITNFSGVSWKAFRKHKDAIAYWRSYCLESHDHAAPTYKVKGVAGTFKSNAEAMEAAGEAYVYGV
ncbi:hypothetical protein B0H14DRAFT_3439222 [Mycena olivaceomarginata]|nr:hypothetical protein B0H14DRAFT_3439222 [Mycena olivaceomarginata]